MLVEDGLILRLLGKFIQPNKGPVDDGSREHRLDVRLQLGGFVWPARCRSCICKLRVHGSPHRRAYSVSGEQDVAGCRRAILEEQLDGSVVRLRVGDQTFAQVDSVRGLDLIDQDFLQCCPVEGETRLCVRESA